MSRRQTKKRDQSESIKSGSKKSEDKIPEEKQKPVDKTDRKDVVKKELLRSLLSSITIKPDFTKGFARLKFPNLNTYTGWIGPNGFEGFGTYTYADGRTFRGSFQACLTRGLGKYEYKNGSTYQGEFLAGRRHGYGQYKTKQFRYDGYFQNGLFHGEGVWKAKVGEQKGIFKDGRIVQGEVHDSSGVFKGFFDESAQRKRGKLTFTNGNYYSGSWLEDLFHGFGVYNWVEEDCTSTKAETSYVGYWSKGKRQALGKLTFRNRVIICQWCNDGKIGAGFILACNGSCYASPEMFNEFNQFNTSNQIKICQESNEILMQINALITPDKKYGTMETKCDAFEEKIKQLVENFSESVFPLYPIHIPHYEIFELPPGPLNTDCELRYVQQVLSENYKEFRDLYKRYTNPTDDYMNNLGLNLLYMDVFQSNQDVDIAQCLSENSQAIRPKWLCLKEKACTSPLSPVPFYEFFQHIIRISEILMENENLKFAVDLLTPTFFGHLAMQTLLILKMLNTQKVVPFLVRDAMRLNRPAIMSILRAMETESPGDKSLRAAYRFLSLKDMVKRNSFIEVVCSYLPRKYLDGTLRDVNSDVSDMELLEIILSTCRLNLFRDTMKQGNLTGRKT